MCIVDRLEVIDVEHHEAGGCFGTNSALKLTAKRFEDCAPVPYPGKQIVRRLKKKLLLSLDLAVLQREDAVASLQSGTQLAFVERLGQIVVSPRLQALDQILFAIFGGCQEDVLVRSAILFSNLATYFHAIGFRHHPVKNEQLRRWVLLQSLPGECAIFRQRDPVS